MPIASLALVLALTQVPAPLPGTAAPAAPPPANATGALAWEQPLSGKPVAPPRVIALPGAPTLVLLALEGSIEARRADDGVLAWQRTDLNGAGLMDEPPVIVDGVPVLGWTGVAGGPTARLILLRATDGTTQLEAPVPARPLGPPAPVFFGTSGAPWWYVPVEGARAAVLLPDGSLREFAATPGEIHPPIFAFGTHALASVGEEHRVVAVGSPRWAGPRHVEPRTHRVMPPFLYAAGARNVQAWTCRARQSGGVRCRQRWRQVLGGTVTAPPLVTPEAVFVGSWDTHLYAFLPDNGHLAWRVQTGARIATPPLFWDDTHIAVLAEGDPLVQFYTIALGRPAGRVSGPPNDVFVAGIARAGDRLVVPALADPTFAPVLRAYDVTFKAPEKKEPAPKKPGEPPDPQVNPTGAR